jgi:predicted RNase H-like nuclease
VELTNAPKRLRYKAAKVRRYWPDSIVSERKTLLGHEWAGIIKLLDAQIMGVANALPPLPPDARGADLKAYEDMLDTVVCAWAAICALDGRAASFGDQDSAIWIPKTAQS